MPIVFTPENEPYLGRNLLCHFDQIISSAMEQNSVTAPSSHGRPLTDPQRMACQVIPQALSIMLSIRELIRSAHTVSCGPWSSGPPSCSTSTSGSTTT
jgi:hypothetical protein